MDSSCNQPSRDFSRYTDPQTIRRLLQERLPKLMRHAVAVDEVAICYARLRTYLKPQSRHNEFLSVCYEVRCAETTKGGQETLTLGGKFFQGGKSLPAYDDILARYGQCNTEFVWHLPDLDLLLWRISADPVLVQMRELTCGERIRKHLPLGATLTSPDALLNVTPQVIAYRPEVRCTTRFDLHFSGGPMRTIYGKSFSDNSGATVFSRIDKLFQKQSAFGTRLLFPRPLGYAPAIRTVWTEGINGPPLVESMSGREGEELLMDLAHGLAELHSGRLDLPGPSDRRLLLVDAEKKAKKIAASFPDLARPLAQIVNQCATLFPELPSMKVCPIHGDLHLRQILHTGEGLALLDFDEMQMGEREQDLAGLFVDLHLGRSRPSDHWTDAFTAQYAAFAGMPNAELIGWHSLIQLVNKAYRTFCQQLPDFRSRAQAIFELASEFQYPRIGAPV